MAPDPSGWSSSSLTIALLALVATNAATALVVLFFIRLFRGRSRMARGPPKLEENASEGEFSFVGGVCDVVWV